jgi:hypothetical protein
MVSTFSNCDLHVSLYFGIQPFLNIVLRTIMFENYRMYQFETFTEKKLRKVYPNHSLYICIFGFDASFSTFNIILILHFYGRIQLNEL